MIILFYVTDVVRTPIIIATEVWLAYVCLSTRIVNSLCTYRYVVVELKKDRYCTVDLSVLFPSRIITRFELTALLSFVEVC
jgi:hypothetical protein